MVKFTFADGQDLCVFDGEKVKKYSSAYIENYKRNCENARRSTEWKHNGEGAIFRGDKTLSNSAEAAIDCTINGIYPTADDD